jgi:DNA-binding transcriptional LysR family regulator
VNTGGKEMNIGWDDLRVFLAVYRARSVAAAGRALGVTHVTAGRRLAALEVVVGRLFERLASGYELTPLGHELLPGAEAMEAGVEQIQRALAVETPARAIVRLAIPEALSEPVLDGLASLRETAPELIVELRTGVDLVSLKRREADLALRLWRFGDVPGENDTFSKRVGRMHWSIHAHPSLLERLELTAPLESLEGVPWVGYGGCAPFIPGLESVRAMPGEPRTVLLSSSLLTVIAAVARGFGIGVLPDLLGARRGLVPISGPVESMAIWMAMYPSAKNDPLVQRVLEHLEQLVATWSPEPRSLS